MAKLVGSRNKPRYMSVSLAELNSVFKENAMIPIDRDFACMLFNKNADFEDQESEEQPKTEAAQEETINFVINNF